MNYSDSQSFVSLPSSFYRQDTVAVARGLLGQQLIHLLPTGPVGGIIVETEAYLACDPASHAYRGQTKRNAAMFGPSGTAYIYFIYGRYWCLNVVTQAVGIGEAVLIRALEPTIGRETMEQHRPGVALSLLTNGPAKLVQALAIPPSYNESDLTVPPLFIAPGTAPAKKNIVTTARIGITQGQDALLRFYIKNNPYISGGTKQV